MRRRWIQIRGELVEVGLNYTPEPLAPAIWGDLPAYESPASGQMIEGRAQRREDFKRTATRPWEGLEQEKREAARQERYVEQHQEQSIDAAVRQAYYQLAPSKRRILDT